MQIGRIEGATRVVGKAHACLGLPLINCSVNGSATPALAHVREVRLVNFIRYRVKRFTDRRRA
jgi:hypothetical protein